jgi:hypothetical protein
MLIVDDFGAFPVRRRPRLLKVLGNWLLGVRSPVPWGIPHGPPPIGMTEQHLGAGPRLPPLLGDRHDRLFP